MPLFRHQNSWCKVACCLCDCVLVNVTGGTSFAVSFFDRKGCLFATRRCLICRKSGRRERGGGERRWKKWPLRPWSSETSKEKEEEEEDGSSILLFRHEQLRGRKTTSYSIFFASWGVTWLNFFILSTYFSNFFSFARFRWSLSACSAWRWPTTAVWPPPPPPASSRTRRGKKKKYSRTRISRFPWSA